MPETPKPSGPEDRRSPSDDPAPPEASADRDSEIEAFIRQLEGTDQPGEADPPKDDAGEATEQIREIGPDVDGEPATGGEAVTPSASEAGKASDTGSDPAPLGPLVRVKRWAVALWQVLTDRTWRHTADQSFRFSLLVAAAVALGYWLTAWLSPNLLSSHPDVDLYLFRPLVWTVVAALAIHGWARLEHRPPLSRPLIVIALAAGFLHVLVLVIAGAAWAFADSSVAERFVDYPRNLLYAITWLAGLEAARAYLFHVWRVWNERLAFCVVATAFFVIALPADQWDVWSGLDEIFESLGGRWVPALAVSILATYLVRLGGLGPSLAYRFPLLVLAWLSPSVPDLPWPVLAVIGIVVPVFVGSSIRSILDGTAVGADRAEREGGTAPGAQPRKEPPLRVWKRLAAWVFGGAAVAVLLAVIGLIGLNALGFRMIVVEDASLEPDYERGDLAVVREDIDLYLLEAGDVIVVDQDGRPVLLHITATIERDDGFLFLTSGEPVPGEEVIGKVVFSVPEAGRLNLWLRGG